MTTLNMPPCTPDEAMEIIRRVTRMPVAVRPAVMLHGEPGAGKSTIVRQVSLEECGIAPIMYHAAMGEASDIKGLPDFDRAKREVVWMKPDFLPRSGKSILFLDDVTSGRREVMAALYPVILDRQVDDLRISDDCTIVCAGNDIGDGAIANSMGTAFSDRVLQLWVKPTPESFVAHWGPRGMSPAILATIVQMPHLFTDNAKRIAEDLAASPTSRSWERAWHMMKAFDVDEDVAAAAKDGAGRGATRGDLRAKAERRLSIVLSGCIGMETAGQLELTMKDIDECIDPAEILAMDLREAKRKLPKTLRAGIALGFSLTTICRTAPEIVKACAIMAMIAEARDAGTIPDATGEIMMNGREIAAFGIERLLLKAEALKIVDAVLDDERAQGSSHLQAYLEDVSRRFESLERSAA